MLTVEENTIVYKEGDKGDYFYIIKTGTFETSENKKQEKTILQSFDYFGELVLLENKRRAQTVKCIESGILYALEGRIYKNLG